MIEHAPAAHRFEPGGSSVRGATTRTRGAQLGERADVRARDAAVADVAADDDRRAPRARPLCLRIVEQSSSACVGCSCAPSPALTTPAPQARGEQVGGARLRVAHHDHVGRHRLEVPRRVEQRLALGRRRRRARDVDRVGRQPLGGDLERRARARRRLEEEVDDRLAAQGRHLLDRPLVDLEEPVAEIEQHGDLRGAEQTPIPRRCRCAKPPVTGAAPAGPPGPPRPAPTASRAPTRSPWCRRRRRRRRAESAARAGRDRRAPPA